MINLTKLEEADLEWARKLRNANRQYFFYNKRLTRKQMIEWYVQTVNIHSPYYYVIWSEGKSIGTISTKKVGQVITLGNIIIDEAFRQKGLLAEVLSKIKGKHFELEVKADNLRAIKAYEKLGFKPYAVRMRK